MTSGGSHEEVVRFHKKNLGIMKKSHPAYLNVSPEVVPMLDHIILTFVYVERLRRKRDKYKEVNTITMTFPPY